MEITKEMIQEQSEDVFQIALDLKAVVRTLVSGMQAGSVKVSASLLKESTATLKQLTLLLANMRAEIERQEIEAEWAVGEDGMTDEQREMLESFEAGFDADGKPISQGDVTLSRDEELDASPMSTGTEYIEKDTYGLRKSKSEDIDLGPPLGDAESVTSNHGTEARRQRFRNGLIYAYGGETFALYGPILEHHERLDYPNLGFNTADLTGGGCVDLADLVQFVQYYYGNWDYDYACDFYWDGVINLSDLVYFTEAINTNAADENCCSDGE